VKALHKANNEAGDRQVALESFGDLTPEKAQGLQAERDRGTWDGRVWVVAGDVTYRIALPAAALLVAHQFGPDPAGFETTVTGGKDPDEEPMPWPMARHEIGVRLLKLERRFKRLARFAAKYEGAPISRDTIQFCEISGGMSTALRERIEEKGAPKR